MADDLCIYDQDNRWIAGGRLIDGLTRDEALRRVAAFAATLPADPPTYHERGNLPGRAFLTAFFMSPLMVPSLVAVGTYALLLAWNEYLYAFLLLSKETDLTLAVALGNFLAADDSPWELLMATGFIYALPPAAIYYAFKRYMVSGLTAGAVKS